MSSLGDRTKGGGGDRGHDIPVGHTHNEGGGAPQGHGAGRGSAAGNVTHTHVSVHGTRHQHGNVCGCVGGGHSFCRTGHGVVDTPNKASCDGK